jgi:hypothetical protein
MELTLTLNGTLMRQGASIALLLTKVPSAKILSGDPSVSVLVSVDKRDIDKLRAAVRDSCTTSSLTELELLARGG